MVMGYTYTVLLSSLCIYAQANPVRRESCKEVPEEVCAKDGGFKANEEAAACMWTEEGGGACVEVDEAGGGLGVLPTDSPDGPTKAQPEDCAINVAENQCRDAEGCHWLGSLCASTEFEGGDNGVDCGGITQGATELCDATEGCAWDATELVCEETGGNNGPDSGVDDTAQCAIYNREECSGDPACTYDSKCAFCKSKAIEGTSDVGGDDNGRLGDGGCNDAGTPTSCAGQDYQECAAMTSKCKWLGSSMTGICEGKGYDKNGSNDDTKDGGGTSENDNFCHNERSEEDCSIAPGCGWDPDSFSCKATSVGGDTGAPMCYTFGRTDCIAQPRCSWELALQKCLVRDDVADGGGATGGGGADGLIEEDDDTDGECGGLTDRNQCGRNGLHCKWDDMMDACIHDMSDGVAKCMDVGGARAPTEDACKAVAGCTWNKQMMTCGTKRGLCLTMETRSNCDDADACSWNAGRKVCELKAMPTQAPANQKGGSAGNGHADGGYNSDTGGGGGGSSDAGKQGGAGQNGGAGGAEPNPILNAPPKKRHTLGWIMALVVVGGIVVGVKCKRDQAAAQGYRKDGMQKFTNPLASYDDEAYASQSHEA